MSSNWLLPGFLRNFRGGDSRLRWSSLWSPFIKSNRGKEATNELNIKRVKVFKIQFLTLKIAWQSRIRHNFWQKLCPLCKHLPKYLQYGLVIFRQCRQLYAIYCKMSHRCVPNWLLQSAKCNLFTLVLLSCLLIEKNIFRIPLLYFTVEKWLSGK